MTEVARLANGNVNFAAVSHIGMRRLNNQDAYVAVLAESEEAWQSRGHLFVVADGMGAHAAGELASKMAVESVAHHYGKHRELSPAEAILKALRDANHEIHQRGQANTEFHNMGTTCSSLLVLPQGAVVAHVGDSRVYRIRGDKIVQLTFDHSLVWEMRAVGSISGHDQPLNIPKNVITRSLGPQATVQVDLEGPLEIQSGDTFLMCSDGLTGRVDDAELGLIAGVLPPEDSANLLVDLANLRGGPDNITVLVIRLADRAPGPRVEPLVVGQELRPNRRVHVGVAIAFLVCSLFAAGFAVLRMWQAAAVAGLASIVASMVAWWQQFGGSHGVALTGGRRLGRGPYAKAECDASAERIRGLVKSIRECSQSPTDSDGDEIARAEACLDEAISRAMAHEPAAALHLVAVAARILARHRGTAG